MKFLNSLGAALLAAALGYGGPASAMPAGEPQSDSGLVVQVRGCHPEVVRHYVPEIGRTAWHRHRRPDCRPIIVRQPVVRDCHRGVERHYLPQYGARVTHRHVGSSCRIRVYDRYDPYRPRPGTCIQIGPIRYCEY